MTTLTLTESEFMHPQTLNPFALACKNLSKLVILNPVVVSGREIAGIQTATNTKKTLKFNHE